MAAGAAAVIEVALLTVKLAALTLPNFTAVTLLKPVPVIATEVAPPAGPLVGLTAVTVGAEPPPAGVHDRVKNTLEFEWAALWSEFGFPLASNVVFENT